MIRGQYQVWISVTVIQKRVSENDALHGRHFDLTKASPEPVQPRRLASFAMLRAQKKLMLKSKHVPNQDPEVFLDGLTYDWLTLAHSRSPLLTSRAILASYLLSSWENRTLNSKSNNWLRVQSLFCASLHALKAVWTAIQLVSLLKHS